MKRIPIMVTAFRDGFQSVFGARVLTDDFLPALEAARDAGLSHFEIGGGARFQSLYFYCNEDAFTMMDRCRAVVGPDVTLQTLARGVNVVGLESQSSDIIRLHAELFRRHGVTTIRNFDALNDIDNLDFSGRAIVDAGLRHEAAITLMGLPPGLDGAHTSDFYRDRIDALLEAEIPMHSLCLKDASGTAPPQVVYETVRLARRRLPADIPVRFHTHDTAGTAVVAYRAAIEAGVDGIDLSMAPLSGGTAQPDIIVMWHALRGTEYGLDVDIERVMAAEEVFKDAMRDYFFPPEAMRVEPLIPFSPMPGGALTANTQMMRDHGVLDRLPDVIRAMREVVERGGFATSVTPVSQFYFQQAFNNVLFGPWQKIAEGYGKMVLGYFGRTPTAPDAAVIDLARAQLGLDPTTERPRALNDADPSKGRAAAEAALRAAKLEVTDEAVFVAATCGAKGIAFLKGEGTVQVRKVTPGCEDGGSGGTPQTVAAPVAPAGAPASQSAARYRVTVEGRTFTVDVEAADGATTSSHSTTDRPSPPDTSGGGNAAVAAGRAATVVTAPMPGLVLRISVAVGDRVAAGDVVAVLECMKMEVTVEAEHPGEVVALHSAAGASVATGAPLVSTA